jgi:AMMECR1 domain-containing protein
MATKQTTKKELESNEFDVDTITVEETIVPKETKQKSLKDTWVIKDRTYIIADDYSPLTYTLQSRHSLRYPLLWFNKETGEQEELRYATNQNSPLVSQQKGAATLGHIVFDNGILNVPKEKQNLQKLLSIYHPGLNVKYTEFDPTLEAEDELEDIELEVLALNAALEMDIDQAESIVRVEVGSRVNKMSSKEIKRDLLLLARNNPSLFIELANDDNVQLRNIAIRAVEANIITLSQDNRTFHWGENNRKLMTVPFDENPYSAMAAFFKTDEGVEVFKSIEKKLK